MPDQPHLKSCLKCWDAHGKKLPCADLRNYRITFEISSAGSWPPCPFRPGVGEVKGWLNGKAPQGLDKNASTILDFLVTKLKSRELNGYLAEMNSDSFGYERHLVVYPDARYGNRTGTFLRRTGNSGQILDKLSKLFGRGDLSKEQRAILESGRDPFILPSVKQGGKAATAASKTFVHRDNLTVENCGVDWDAAIAKAAEGGTWLSVNIQAGFIDPPKLLKVMKTGLGKVEAAARKGLSKDYLEPELQKIPPFNLDKEGRTLALELAKGMVFALGMAAGAAAFGTAAGAVIGTFVAPGLGTAGGAAAGASLATGLTQLLMNAWDLGSTASEVAKQEGATREACQLALDGKEEASARKFATIFAVILAALAIALIALAIKRGYAAIKNRSKLSQAGQKYLSDKADEAAARKGSAKPAAKTSGGFQPKIPDPQVLFKNELGNVNKFITKKRKQIVAIIDESADKWSVIDQQEAMRLRGRILKANRLLRSYVPETAGHIQVVCAGGQILKHRLATFAKHTNLAGMLQENGLSERQAEKVAALLRRLDPAALDFGQHDLTHKGSRGSGKISLAVATRLSLEAKTLERWVEKNDKLFATYEAKFRGKPASKIPAEDKAALAKELKISVADLEEAIEVDFGRVRHNQSFAHHLPQTDGDWAEFGIDVMAALSQERSYKKGKLLSEISAAEIDKTVSFMKEIDDKDLAAGMIKFSKIILGGLDEQWVMNPQKTIGNLLTSPSIR